MITSSKTVLVVAPDSEARDAISNQIEFEGLFCDVALDTLSAMQKMDARIYDILLIDTDLLNMAEIDLINRAILSQGQITILLTACGDLGGVNSQPYLASGLSLLLKPFNFEEFERMVEIALARKAEMNNETFEKINIALDAICEGVEIRLDDFESRSKFIIERTCAVAISLGMQKEEVFTWASAKLRAVSSKKIRMLSGVRRLELNPLAQSVLGMSRELIPRDSESYTN